MEQKNIIGNVSMAKTQVKPENEIFELLEEAETALIRAQAVTIPSLISE